MRLGATNIGATIPASIGRLQRLEVLDLAYCLLDGPLPDSLGACRALRVLNLPGQGYGLTGTLRSVASLTNLVQVDVSRNELSGTLPPELGNNAQLVSLKAWVNRFTGGLPVELGQCAALQELDVRANRLSGPLPASLGQLSHLTALLADYNRFSGPLPVGLGQLPALQHLTLAGNQLTGPLAAALVRRPTLVELRLDDNGLTDVEDLGGATGLPVALTLAGNYLDYAALERLYVQAQQPRVTAVDVHGQRPPLPVDTVSYPLYQPLRVEPRRQGPHAEQYQWQRLVGGQWADMPGETQASLRWPQATAAAGGTYRRQEHDSWFTPFGLAPVVLYSAAIYADPIPYPPLARNRPDDANPGPAPLAPPAAPDATAPAVAPDMNYVRVWTPRQALTQAALGPARPPGVRREQWAGISGGVTAIPLATAPGSVQQVPALEATTSTVFNYGARLRAWLTPPQTGNYIFYLCASTSGELWLSSDQDPSHAVALASSQGWTSGPRDYTRYPSQQSAPVALVAGRSYYLEVRHQHDWGPGYVAVSWQLPDGTPAGPPIAGQYLQPYEDGGPGPADPTWTVEQASMSTQYLDGLGRPVQTVQWQASPGKRDVVQPQAYDGLGREPRAYLPYAADSADGGYRPRGLAEQGRFYGPSRLVGPPSPTDPTRSVARTGVAFSETQFEPSPLNRVTAQAAPGEAWQLTGGHAQERRERPNVFADSLLRFAPGYAPADPDPHCQGSYAPGELWGVLTRDEHGAWRAEWTDKQGQVVVRAVQAQSLGEGPGAARRWLRTCYAYDDFGRLRAVLPPEASRRQLAAVRALAPAPPPAGVLAERWANVAGTAVADVPVGQAPNSVGVLPRLELVDGQFHYGARLRAWLLPPQNGDYTFYLAGNDAAELWLSPDADPAHRVKIATSSLFLSGPRDYRRNAEQQSVLVPLRSDHVYYLEVVLKQEWGPGYASVSWQLPDGTPAGQPIAGAYLSPYDPALPPPPPAGTVPLPAAALPAAAAPFLFHYRYDGRGRQLAKQVPGTDGETLVVFDQLDRPVLAQDAAQRGRREWSWTKYDALGRVALSGLVSRADTAGQVTLQALADASTTPESQYEQRTDAGTTFPHYYTTNQAFPRLGLDGFSNGYVLSATYYDDYNFDNDAASVADATYNPSTDGQFPAGQAPVADALRTTGMTTRTKTRVLGVDPADASQAAWLTTTTFYDERARPVQVQTTNARKGLDVLTTRLNFPGQVVQSVAVHHGPSLPAAGLTVAEFFTYDHTGRLLTTRQQLPGEARAARIDSVAYNEIGQATQNTMGTSRLAQSVDFAYNIRGWLTQLNDPYYPQAQNLFNLSLHYEAGFSKGYEQYNGNLTGQTWRSARDGVQRAYGYVYDPLNRLLQGDFVARTAAAPATPTTPGLWKGEEDNYRMSFVSYDDNGNLLSLRRRGLLANATHASPKQFGPVDALTYAYAGNRLQAVDDAVSTNQLPRPRNDNGAPTSLAGDFQEGGTHLAQEYLYDANGNLTQDRNKGITGIAYNHLNLPKQIHFGLGADSLVFRYTAAGQKVAKLVYQTGKPLLRTDYLGPYQYEQDSLRFFPHAEGRVLRFVSTTSGAVRYEREFTFKDHLGNLRLAYRLGQHRTYSAGMEPSDAARETQQFDSLSVSAPVAQNVGPAARTRQYVARLNAGGPAPQPLGPLTQLAVQKGDTITVTAPGYYPQPVSNNSFAFSLASFVAGLLQPPPGAPRADGRRGGLPLLNIGISAALPGLVSVSGGVPKGYVRLLVFDADSNLVGSQTQQLSQAARTGYESLQVQVIAQQDGYVTAYVGNESNADVYFDDVSVTHGQGLQVQETQYDPTGLELAGLTRTTPGLKPLNQYKFNGKEFQADLGLNWNHQDWRFFDTQLARWHVTDPEIENGQESWTPYAFGFDNAVRYADANGRYPGPGDDVPTVARGFVDFSASVVNLVLSSWAYTTGSSTKLQAQVYETNTSLGINYARVSVGSLTQEAKSTALNVANVAINIMPAGRAGAGRALEQAAGKAAAAEVSLEARATAIQNVQPAGKARNMSTTAVGDVINPDGTASRIVASSRRYLSRAQQAAMKPGEVAAKGAGHAETTILDHAAANGQTVTKVAASRPICQPCQEALKKASVQAGSTLK